MKRLITYFSTPNALSLVIGSTLDRLWSDIDPLKSRKFLSILALLLTIGVGNVWGATATMTGVSNATASTVNSKSAFKCGTGSASGSMKVTVPANATVLALYCAAWKGESPSITITPNTKVSPTSFSPSADNGISGSGTSYTLSGTESTYLKTITLSSITTSTDIQFANSGKNKRFAIWGARYVFNPTSPTNGTITSNSAQLSWSYGNSTDKYEIYYSTSSSAPSAGTTATIGISTIGTTKSYTITGLSSGTTYYWWVRAVDPDGYCKSAWVAGSSFTTTAAVTTYTIYLPNTVSSCNTTGSFTSNQGTLGSGTGGWTGYKTYSGITAGTSVTITATPESGYSFDGWTDGGYSIIVDDEANEVSTTSTTSTTATFNMPSSDVYIMSCYFSSACANQVALTKGAESNGSFSLSSANGSYDNCDNNFVVTVSSITPSSGYGCIGVTATGGNSTVTGPDGSGNYTVTYTKGNSITSTVTANFAAKCATPTFSVSGGTYNATQSVTLSCATDGATIYYTTNGSTPTTSSSVYSSAISVTSTNTTIKAIAAKSSMANSDVASATYVLKCATPVITPATGTFTGAQDVTITCATAGASIYYTNNGGTPSSSSTAYSAFSVDATKTIKAIATKSGWTDSDIATSTITIQYNVTWMVNGVAYTTGDPTSKANSGTAWSSLKLPTDPTPPCGDVFVGWTTDNIGTTGLDKDDDDDATRIAALNLMTSANKSGKSTTITNNVTFYAVFADYTTD